MTSGNRRIGANRKKWRSFTLAELGSNYGGLSGKSSGDFGKGSKYIPYVNVFNNYQIDVEALGLVVVHGDEQQNRVKYGDILFTTSSETPDEVGMTSVLLEDVPDLYLNSFCFGYRLYDFNSLLPQYAKYLLRSPEIRSQMTLLAQGSTRFNISKAKVLRFKVRLPDLDEQAAIVKVLDCASDSITNLERHLKQLKNEKTALMSRLLSSATIVHLPDNRVEA